MTPGKRLALCAAAVGAVVALAVDWDPDQPARRQAMPRHPSARPRPVQGCSCTLCRARRAPLVPAAGGVGRPSRLQFSDEEVSARFAGIVSAHRRRTREDS